MFSYLATSLRRQEFEFFLIEAILCTMTRSQVGRSQEASFLAWQLTSIGLGITFEWKPGQSVLRSYCSELQASSLQVLCSCFSVGIFVFNRWVIPLSPLQLALFPQSVVWVVIYSMFLPWRLSPLLSPILFPHWAAASYFGTLCPFSWAWIANPDLDYERLLLHIATTINTATTSTTFNFFYYC